MTRFAYLLLLIACGRPTGAPGTFRLSLEHDGVDRQAIVHVPDSYTDAPTPLMLNFHGFGGTAESHMEWADMRAHAERDAAIVVYPQGDEIDGGTHWNSALPGGDNKSDSDDVGFVRALLESIEASYTIDPDRIYASGYSNGAMFAFSLACRHSDLVAGVASVSGAMLDDLRDDCTPTHPTAVITLHGTADSVLPYNGDASMLSVDETLDQWNRLNATASQPTTASGGDASTIEHLSFAGGTGDVRVEHYRYVGGEHVWFDDTYQGSDASTLVWDFLHEFDRDGAR